MAQYRVGTVTVTNGSPVVTGAGGPEWDVEAAVGDLFSVADGPWYEVLTVDDEDQLTLTVNYEGATAAGVTYAIHRNFTDAQGYAYPSYGDVNTAGLLQDVLTRIDAQVLQLGSGAGALEGTTESLFTIRSGFAGTPADDAGIVIERGTESDASFLFKDSQVNKRWEFGGKNVGEIGELHVSGKIGIGQEPGAEKLEVTGNVVITGNVAAATFNSYTPLNAASYTAADVLAKLLTVDGSASGLDADTVRGTTPSTHGRALLASADVAATKTILSLTKAVLGPTSVTDGRLAAFDGTTGELIKELTPAQAKTFLAITQSDVTSLVSDLALKAPLTSPALLGTPTAPTAAAATNTTQIATTAFVKTALDALVSAAPGLLDTLDEIAAALGDDPNFATTITTLIGTKLNSSAVGAFGLTLIDDATQADARTTLGLGTAAYEATGFFAAAVHDHVDMFHASVTGEFNALAAKTTVAAGDYVVIEDSAASFAKKKVLISNLPPGISMFRYAFDSSTTTSADPGAGEWRFNNPTIASVTAIAFNDADAFGGALEALMLSFDDLGSSTTRGHFVFRKVGTPATFAIYRLTGSITDSAGWTQHTVVHVSSNGSWSAADVADIMFLPAGVTGTTGSTGTHARIGPTYNWVNTTSAADPTAGNFRTNSTTLASVTEFYFDDVCDANSGSIDLSTMFAAWAAGGKLMVRGTDTTTQWAQFTIVSVTDNTGWFTVVVTLDGCGANWSNGNDQSFTYVPPGAVGPAGPTGAAGSFTGPGSAVDSRLVAFDGTSGGLGKDSGYTAANLLDRANHTGAQLIATVTGLQAALDAKIAGPGTVTSGNPVVFSGTTGLAVAQVTFSAFKSSLALVKADVGLGSVDNTSDAGKPVSTAQQTALDLKANLASPAFTGTPTGITATHVGLGNVTNTSDANKPVSTAQQTALDLKANLASPALATPTLTNPIITGAITEDVYTITDGAAFQIDPANGSIQKITLTASRTPAATNFVDGESVTMHIADGSAFTITWSTVAVTWVGGTAPTLATTGWTIVELWKSFGTIYGVHVGDVA